MFLRCCAAGVLLLSAALPCTAVDLGKQALGPAGGSTSNGQYSISFTAGLVAIGLGENNDHSSIGGFWFRQDNVTDVGDQPNPAALPRATRLYPNRPNPFNPRTTIAFDIAGDTGSTLNARLAIYDIRGHHVTTLVNGPVNSGRYETAWDGTDTARQQMPSGVYLAQFRAGSVTETIRLVLLK